MNFTRAYWSKTYLKQSNYSRTLYTALFFLCLLIGFGSCKKTGSFYLEGDSPEPPFNVESADTFTVTLESEKHTFGGQNFDDDMLGTFIDPAFGRSTGNVYTQVGLDDRNPSFTATSGYDSFVLYIHLQRNAYIGQLADVQNWKVYELVNALESGKSYSSDTTLAVSQKEIGSFSGSLNAKDSVLHIQLNQEFAQKFFNADKNNFADNPSFVNFLKGIAIIPDSTNINGSGAVIAADFSNTKTRLVLYHDKTKSFAMDFQNVQHVNTYSHNYKGSAAGNAIGNHFSDKAYRQAMGGLRLHVQFPYLKNLVSSDKKLALHQAILILPRTDSASDTYNSNYPKTLLLNVRLESGKSSTATVEGTYSAADHAYHFDNTRFTDYFQELLAAYENGEDVKPYGLNISIDPEAGIPTRTIISAAKTGINRPKLVLTFTKLGQ